MLLFDNIKDFPRGFRVSSNTMSGIRRMALGLGLDPKLPNVDLVKAWKEKLKTFKPLAPKKVNTGPILENFFSGKDVDLLKFPAPKWHERDGGTTLEPGRCVFTARSRRRLGQYGRLSGDRSTTPLRLAFSSTTSSTATDTRKNIGRRQRNCPVRALLRPGARAYLWRRRNGSLGASGARSSPVGLRGSPVEILSGEASRLADTCARGDRRRRRNPSDGARVSSRGAIWRTHRLLRHRHRNEPVIKVSRGHASQRSDHSRRPAAKTGAGNGPLRHSSASRLPCGPLWNIAAFPACRGVWQHGPFATVIAHQAALRRTRSSSRRHRVRRAALRRFRADSSSSSTKISTHPISGMCFGRSPAAVTRRRKLK